ncbi:MAG TPA: HNH endonuclease [Chiayiivirga sp.]|nr:HNH endonuclease [Chiayiivirga sp.]
MPWKPPVHDPRKGLLSCRVHKPKPSRQKTRFLHTGSKQWRDIRHAQLDLYPLCEMCSDPATEVDHRHGNTKANRIHVDLASLCKPCHSRKTATEMTGRKIGSVGCDASGIPLDPASPWKKIAES